MSQDARRQEELNTQRRAQILGLNYFDTSGAQPKQLYRQILTNQEMYGSRVVPLQASEHAVMFGVTNNTSRNLITSLPQRFIEQKVDIRLISDSGFREYMRLYDPPPKVEYPAIELKAAGSEQLVRSVSAALERVRADDILAYLVQQAHQLKASDIHLETQRQGVRVRLRIDGVLHAVANLTAEKYRVVIAAVASAGNISTAADEAQQGHIAQRVVMADGQPVDVNVRLETVPTINGMDIVMRLFNLSREMYSLDRLGLSAAERAVVDDIIAKPSGLVLVVGPTGSGKTTTLYSMLSSLNSEERKIITIEDPVEYQFDGLTQISVRSRHADDASFAERLRAVLRLDPDVVMVGEIRDLETAKTALQASLTGHLVLATFHAGSAAAALTRLHDIIRDNPLFVSAIRLVMAQRLVRRLDETTRQSYQPEEVVRQRLAQIVAGLPANMDRPNLDQITLYRPGRSEENPYGYRGQLAVREQFLMTGQIRGLLEGHGTWSSAEIEAAAIASGMRTMLQDGVLKVLDGQTSLAEVVRVLG